MTVELFCDNSLEIVAIWFFLNLSPLFSCESLMRPAWRKPGINESLSYDCVHTKHITGIRICMSRVGGRKE